jgi:hypothetical protein
MFAEKKYKMQHLEGNGTSILYIGRRVLKVKVVQGMPKKLVVLQTL